MSARGLICVFAKPPVPGQVKTRLAAQVGDARAAAFAQAFLRDTWAAVSDLPWAEPILATTEGTASDFGLPGEPTIWLQGEGDLGQRLERIVQRGLTEADFVIAIGADSPGLPDHVIAQAHAKLAKADAVLGPCDDGGFYLIGLRRCPSSLFAHLPWSASTTCMATRERLQEHHMTVDILDSWFDVDRAEDLVRLRTMIITGDVHANETARLLTASACPISRGRDNRQSRAG